MKPLVLDTSVLISGLIGHGASSALIDALFADRLTIAHTTAILAEYADVMERPAFGIEPSERAAIFLKIRASGIAVQPAAVPNLQWPDRYDVPFVAAALATEVKTVVTLNPKDFEPAKSLDVKVLSPSEALRLIRE